MTKRTTYHVTKTEDGWQGKKEGGERASVKGNTKEDVVGKTIAIAKNQDASSVKIHKADGKCERQLRIQVFWQLGIHNIRQECYIENGKNECIVRFKSNAIILRFKERLPVLQTMAFSS